MSEYSVLPMGLINLIVIPPPTRTERVYAWLDQHERTIRFVLLSCLAYWLIR